MIGNLKIKIDKDPQTGEMCLPPEVKDLLIRFSEHRYLCEQCDSFWITHVGGYCATGGGIIGELLKHPLVEFIPTGGEG